MQHVGTTFTAPSAINRTHVRATFTAPITLDRALIFPQSGQIYRAHVRATFTAPMCSLCSRPMGRAHRAPYGILMIGKG